MGYRSDVQAVIYGTRENLDAYLTAHLYIFGSPVMKAFEGNLKRYVMKTYEGTEYHILHLYEDNTKWYEDYPEIQAWMEFMNGSTEMDLEHEFIRVGENTGDVDEQRTENAHGFLYVTSPQIGNDFDMNNSIPLLQGATTS